MLALVAALLLQVERIPKDGSSEYAVVVTRRTYADAGWKAAVEALVKKHTAVVVVCPSFGEARKELAAIHPRFACFVARPDELGRDPVIAMHRLTRRLDDDPYTDVRWGIITGYEAKDAQRIAECKEPLLVRRGAAGCGLDLTRYESGVWFSEGEKNLKCEKRKSGAPQKGRCADDSTAEIVAEFNAGKPDLFLTSGHATERDWQIGFSYPNGQLRCADGRLFGLDLAGKRHPIESPNPKVYLAAGNCRMGLVPDRDAMALAWMRSAGVHQMIGYVVSTWHGAAGWGANDYFQAVGLPLADAFFANTQWMVRELETRFAATARIDFDEWDIETDDDLLGKLAARHGLGERDELGLLWDRDTLAFYGDPAWIARLAKPLPPFEVALIEKDGTFTIEATSMVEGAWPRPPFAFLPRRVQGAKVVEGEALVTDDFVMLTAPAKLGKGQRIRAVIRAAKR